MTDTLAAALDAPVVLPAPRPELVERPAWLGSDATVPTPDLGGWRAGEEERAAFADDGAGVCASLAGEGPVLLAFGGMFGTAGAPPFEFGRVGGELGCRTLAVRDHARFWYHAGARGAGSTLPALVEHLRGLLASAAPGRLVVVGNSAGAYAALVAGALLGADAVHAFAPRTTLLEGGSDPSVWEERRALLAATTPTPELLDAREVLAAHPADGVHVHYCRTHGRDSEHALRLADLPTVALHGWPVGGHELVGSLRRSGELVPLLRAALRS
ncbi:hypothetical protein EV189_1133 [Motilibacter rhizosphaerae]|uniref:Alpha/beta hydrolase family protein n=1 Tax=Motilibacter rhizosphaerae TaxID=598652 RepID=A0A4Q7NRA9_9ACTN|nr:hypothetical protein [Motilibacter rhizosphaerae]RZS89370.1 hypothetical protein EV189_1133 [Motilibacter rhizosphaerae]